MCHFLGFFLLLIIYLLFLLSLLYSFFITQYSWSLYSFYEEGLFEIKTKLKRHHLEHTNRKKSCEVTVNWSECNLWGLIDPIQSSVYVGGLSIVAQG